MRKKKSPGLKSEDAQLWQRVAETTKPLPAHLRNLATNKLDVIAAPMAQPPEGAKPCPPAKAKRRTLPTEIREKPIPVRSAPVADPFDKPTLRKLQKGRIRVDARLDLHGMTQSAARQELGQFLQMARWSDTRLVLVITGKGNDGSGVLKQNVPRWLSAPPLNAMVSSVAPATPRHGGEGALYVRLRRRNPGQS